VLKFYIYYGSRKHNRLLVEGDSEIGQHCYRLTLTYDYAYHVSRSETCGYFLHCLECRETEGGHEYMGTLSMTVSGKHCQAWSSNTPHMPSPSYTADNFFPDGSRKAAMNYCRNPDPSHSDGVWCYTMDPNERRAPCNVPLCCKFMSVSRYVFKYLSKLFFLLLLFFAQRMLSPSVLTLPDYCLSLFSISFVNSKKRISYNPTTVQSAGSTGYITSHSYAVSK